MPERRWANLERLAVAWLEVRTTATVCTERPQPAQFEQDAMGRGVVQVQYAGGAGDDTEHQVPLEVELFTGTRRELWDLGDLVEAAMSDLATDGNDEGYVDAVAETFLFAPTEHPNPKIRSATGTFTITVRPL